MTETATTSTKASDSTDALVSMAAGALTQSLADYTKAVAAQEASIIEIRERHETERSEMTTRHLAEIEAARSTDSLREMRESCEGLRDILMKLGATEVAEGFVIPAVPGQGIRRRQGGTRSAAAIQVPDRKDKIRDILSANPDGLTAKRIAQHLHAAEGVDVATVNVDAAEINRTQSCLANGVKTGTFVKTMTDGSNTWTLAAVADATVADATE